MDYPRLKKEHRNIQMRGGDATSTRWEYLIIPSSPNENKQTAGSVLKKITEQHIMVIGQDRIRHKRTER